MVAAGQVVEADEFAAMQPRTYYAQASGNTTINSSTTVDVPATVNFTTVFPNAQVDIRWTADFRSNNTSAGISVCFVRIDSTDITTPQAIFQQGTTSDRRFTVGQSYVTTIASAGNHTISLRANRASGSSEAIISGTHTTITVVVTETVPA